MDHQPTVDTTKTQRQRTMKKRKKKNVTSQLKTKTKAEPSYGTMHMYLCIKCVHFSNKRRITKGKRKQNAQNTRRSTFKHWNSVNSVNSGTSNTLHILRKHWICGWKWNKTRNEWYEMKFETMLILNKAEKKVFSYSFILSSVPSSSFFFFFGFWMENGWFDFSSCTAMTHYWRDVTMITFLHSLKKKRFHSSVWPN